METYTPTAVQGSGPGKFNQVFWWKSSDVPSRVIKIQILGIFLGLLSGLAFLIHALGNGISAGNFNFKLGILEIGLGFAALGLFLAALAAMVVLHELAHGLTMRVFGARPQYGARLKQLVFYATAPGYGFRRNAYIIAMLAPLVLLSVPAILGMSVLQGTAWAVLLAVCAAFNIGGAAGDLWMVWTILGYSRMAYIVDEPDGFRVLMRKE